jgi:putative oxygen-independent coproporphyrinogen III oxidase
MSRWPLTLYVHMPWCVRKCPYCDFNSHQLKASAPSAGYIDALLADFDAESRVLEGLALEGRPIEAVFFGGGTPSLFKPAEYARLLAELKRRANFAVDVEITLEANPGTIERGNFSGYRDAGINRVSLGAQSFVPAALTRLGRIHRAEDTHLAVEELRAAGIANFNLDLMYALPEQTLEAAVEDVRIACDLGPAHISHYQLTLEPGTVFHAQPPPLPDDDVAFAMQRECQRELAARGFEQYEVSAYARPGARCRHNLNYWRFGDYLGLGAGAHGKFTAGVPDAIVRTEKPRQPREYLERVQSLGPGARLGTRQAVAQADLPFEFMLNALRLNEGFAWRDYEQRTGLERDGIAVALERVAQRGLLELTPTGARASELGRRFLNDLQGAFLA